jgi:D-alanine-D-alanine ligase
MIYILYGGPSSENEVSKKSKEFYKVLLAAKNPREIEWLTLDSFKIDGKELTLAEMLQQVKSTSGIVVNSTHGEYGEDGWIQKHFEDNNIRFTGSDAQSSALAMDKVKAQEMVKDIVTIIKTYTSTPTQFNLAAMYNVIGENYPIFIKPNAKGSSVNTYKISSEPELLELMSSLPTDTYLFQPAITGMEVSMGTVCNQGEFYKLYPTEIIPASSFFDYDSKYQNNGAKEITPARLSDELLKKIATLANKIHIRLGLGFYSRSDFIVHESGAIYYLETNTLPGFTATSLLPQQLKYSKLLEKFAKDILTDVC